MKENFEKKPDIESDLGAPPKECARTRETTIRDKDEETGCQGCCSCPHGAMGAVAMIAVAISMGLSGFATSRCDFLNVDMGESWIIERPVGIYLFLDVDENSGMGQCVLWTEGDDNVYDETWSAARIMAMVAGFCGLITMILMFTASCVTYPRALFNGLAFLLLFVFLFYGLSFMVFGSDICSQYGCEFGGGGIAMIVAVILWLVSSYLVLWVPTTRYKQQTNSSGRAGAVPQRNDKTMQKTRRIWLGVALTCILVIGLVNGLVIGLRESSNVPRQPAPPTMAPLKPSPFQECESQFETNLVCNADEDICIFHGLLNGSSCKEYCAAHGGTCHGAGAPGGTDACDIQETRPCEEQARDMLCKCTRVPMQSESVQKCHDQFKTVIVCSADEESCAFHAWLYGSSCEEYCYNNGGSCLKAEANADDQCGIQETRPCEQGASDMICTCSFGAVRMRILATGS